MLGDACQCLSMQRGRSDRETKSTVAREFGNLLAIRDNYRKMVVSMDVFAGGSHEGIDRAIKTPLLDSVLHSNKVTMLYGPRQAGKTTLSKEVIHETGLRCLAVNADQMRYLDFILASPRSG